MTRGLVNEIYMYFCPMTKLVLVGTGNLARQLFTAFQGAGELKIIQVVGRNPDALAYFDALSVTGPITGITDEGDIYIIALSDDAICAVSESFNFRNKLIVHTSGSVAMSSLPVTQRRGVMYPLQTFSAGRKPDFTRIPFCIEAEHTDDLQILHDLASNISGRVLELSSEKRRVLHLAAVYANNFSNHMFFLSGELARQAGLDTEVLFPLIEETVEKLRALSPYEAQTGPARRQDEGTINQHLELLKDPLQRQLYSTISNSIKQTYDKKL